MAIDYDGTLKILVDGNASGFYRLLGSDGPRTSLPTEFSGPLKGRMDHLSTGPGGLLHVEFQSTPDRMNWRMVEYYCAIAREFASVRRGEERVLQWVLYVGKGTVIFENWIRQDGLSFCFKTGDIRDLDGSALMDSRVLSEAILGLLCMRVIHIDDWERVLGRVEKIGTTSQVQGRDALALFAAAIAIRGAPPAIRKRARTLGMRLDVSKSEILRDLVDEKLAAGAAAGTRDALRVVAASKGVPSNEMDDAFVEALSTSDAQQAIVALSMDEDWGDIVSRFQTKLQHQ